MLKYDFDEVFSRIKTVTGWNKQLDMANFLEVHQSSITNPKKKNYFPIEWATRIGIHFNVNINWILTGKEGQEVKGNTFSGDNFNLDKKDSKSFSKEKYCENEKEDGTGYITDIEKKELMEKVGFILDSNTIYTSALAENITAFHKAALNEVSNASNDDLVEIRKRLQSVETELLELKAKGKKTKAG